MLMVRGGHVAITQAIQFGKPVITVPIENHGEQLGNSEKISRLGMGIMVHPKRLKAELIVNAISEILEEDTYTKRASEIQRQAENLDGIENAVKIIRSYI
jgi:UDP:flavonoid glycosyltransferase YjiC (YdhE family)